MGWLIWDGLERLAGDCVPEWLGTGDFGGREAQLSV